MSPWDTQTRKPRPLPAAERRETTMSSFETEVKNTGTAPAPSEPSEPAVHSSVGVGTDGLEVRQPPALNQPGHETTDESGKEVDDGIVTARSLSKATNLVSPLPICDEAVHGGVKRKAACFVSKKDLFGGGREEADYPAVGLTQREDEGRDNLLPQETPRKLPRSLLPKKMSAPGQTMMAEDQMTAVLKDVKRDVDPSSAMQDIGLTFVAFDSRRPPGWMKVVCAMNNRYYKLYLDRRFKTLESVEGEMEKLVQSVTKTFQNADTPFDRDDVAWRMLALNQMLLMRSKRIEQQQDVSARCERIVQEEEALRLIEAADNPNRKVLDWRLDPETGNKSDSCEEEEPVCNKKPAAKRTGPARELLGPGPVRIDCSHWKSFRGAERCILGIGVLEYDREGNVWYTRAEGGL